MGSSFSRTRIDATREIGLGPLSHEEVRAPSIINPDGSPVRQAPAHNSSSETPRDVESQVIVRVNPRWTAKKIVGATLTGALTVTAVVTGGVFLFGASKGVKPKNDLLPTGTVGAGGLASAPTAYDYATPPPPLTLSDLSPNTLAHLRGASVGYSEDELIDVVNRWHATREPDPTLVGREKQHYVGATYRNTTAPLYSVYNGGLPHFTNVAIDAGDTLAQIRPAQIMGNGTVPFSAFDDAMVQASGTAMAAIAAVNPNFVKSMVREDQAEGTYTVGAKFASSDYPGEVGEIPLTISQRVLTDFVGEVLGVSLKDQGAVLWPATLRKFFTKFAQTETIDALTSIDSVFRMATGRTPLMTDLSRAGDSDAWGQGYAYLGDDRTALVAKAEASRPSQDFDAHMDALVNSPGAAAVFELRAPAALPFMEGYEADTEKVPFGTHSFVAPALRGAAIQVLGAGVNEIVSAKPYVFVSAEKRDDGKIQFVTLWDPSSETLDCQTISYQILNGDYQGNPFTGTQMSSQEQINARFSEWDSLPRKLGLVRLPYDAFKLLARKVTQVQTTPVTLRDANESLGTGDGPRAGTDPNTTGGQVTGGGASEGAGNGQQIPGTQNGPRGADTTENIPDGNQGAKGHAAAPSRSGLDQTTGMAQTPQGGDDEVGANTSYPSTPSSSSSAGGKLAGQPGDGTP